MIVHPTWLGAVPIRDQAAAKKIRIRVAVCGVEKCLDPSVIDPLIVIDECNQRRRNLWQCTIEGVRFSWFRLCHPTQRNGESLCSLIKEGVGAIATGIGDHEHLSTLDRQADFGQRVKKATEEPFPIMSADDNGEAIHFGLRCSPCMRPMKW